MNDFEMILPFLKPIEHLILDESISEVMVNGPGRVFIEKQGFVHLVPGISIGEKSLMVAVKNIARRLGDDISESKPILDSRLPDGSRVAAVIPPCSLGGVTLTIRKFNTRHFEMEDLIRTGTLDRALANRLEDCVLAQKNILISGGTGTGKTTLLSILGKFIPQDERVLVIEDTAEIQLPQENLVRFEARLEQNGHPAVAIRDLLKAALRLRSVATAEHGAFRRAVHHPCQHCQPSARALHELRSTKRCGPPLSGHQNQHRSFAQHRHPGRSSARTQIHFGGPRNQRI
jgi:pilus assembly protein CpaF